MSALDDFVTLKAKRDGLARLTWQSPAPSVRCFYPDDGCNTREYQVTEDDLRLFSQAVADVERAGAATSYYYGGDAIGSAFKRCVLRYLDKRLIKLARVAQKEAESCLSILRVGGKEA